MEAFDSHFNENIMLTAALIMQKKKKSIPVNQGDLGHVFFIFNYKFIANIEIDLLYRNRKGKKMLISATDKEKKESQELFPSSKPLFCLSLLVSEC